MRICYIAPSVGHTNKMIEYYAQRGDEIHLISFEKPYGEWKGVYLHHIDLRIQLLQRILYRSYTLQSILVRGVLRTIHPDILHAHYVSTYGILGAKLGFRPLVLSIWGSDLLIEGRGRKRQKIKRALEAADLIHTTSHEISRIIVQEFGIPTEKIYDAPFGIDTDLFIPAPEGRNDFERSITIINNRNLDPVYDHYTLIRGFALAIREFPDLKLILTSYGSTHEKIKKLVQELGLSSSVSLNPNNLHQGILYEEMPKVLQDADIYVSTNISDSVSVSLLEAMSTGLPCIATAIGGSPEWITDGENGFLIPPHDFQALADRIVLLARDRDLRRRLGNQARKLILTRGGISITMDGLKERYRKITDQG